MNTIKIFKPVEIIDICTFTDGHGLIKIKPIQDIRAHGYDVNSFDNTTLWVANHRNHKLHGPVLFGDTRWVSHENTSRHLVHIEGDSEIAFQLRLYALVSHFNGSGEGYNGEKLSTLQAKLTALKKFGTYLLSKGLSSFQQLEHLPEIRLRTLLTDYITAEVMSSAPTNKPRIFNDCFNPVRSLGIIGERTFGYLQDVLDNVFNKPPETLSHPIIPTDIARRIASFATSVVSECEKKIAEFAALNEKLIKHLEEDKPYYEQKNWSVSEIFNYAARRSGTHTELSALHEYFVDLKVAVYIHILLFTGMRYNEALSCKIGCTYKSRPEEGLYLVEALTHKTTDTTFLDRWVTNKDTYNAIRILERYCAIITRRAEVIQQHFCNKVQKSSIHNLEIGIEENRLFGIQSSAFSVGYVKSGRFEDFEVKSPYFKDKFDLTVTQESVQELERLDQNYSKVRGSDRGQPYSVGDTLRLSNHMFRHTFAYFVVANKLGEFEDIADQFKHLNLAMTKVYADKAILSFGEVADLVSGYEQLMTDAIAAELTEQAANGSLRGGAGERFNKAATELVIGITDSKSPRADVISQVHFKNLAEFQRFLAKNLESVRGLPHGYCTAGDSCKIKGAAVPSGCVHCGSFIVAETHKIHWRAMKNKAQKKLAIIESLAPERQKDLELLTIAHKRDLKAAEQALGASKGNIPATEGEML